VTSIEGLIGTTGAVPSVPVVTYRILRCDCVRVRDDGQVREPRSQYDTEGNLAARQYLWQNSARRPAFSLYSWVVGLARLTGGESVLEVGCGNGAYLELMPAVGLDSSVGMLGAARARAQGPLIAGDATMLPFRDRSFDFVLAAHMLYHVADRELAASELRRVLAGSGTCVAVSNGEQNQAELVALLEDVVGHGWKWRRPSDRAFSLENGAAQLAAAFENIERVDCPPGVVEVTDPPALADYLNSVADHYQAEISRWTAWDDVVRECTRRVATEVGDHGSFSISTSVGAFICQ
jgi:SAM-dependent methyltransferase